jgi:hypothetical protein
MRSLQFSSPIVMDRIPFPTNTLHSTHGVLLTRKGHLCLDVQYLFTRALSQGQVTAYMTFSSSLGS